MKPLARVFINWKKALPLAGLLLMQSLYAGTSQAAANLESEAEVKTRSFIVDISDGASMMTALDLKIGGKRVNEYRFKLGFAYQTNCADDEGYSSWTSVKDRLVYDFSDLSEDVKLCVLGHRTRRGQEISVQDPANATSYQWYMDVADTIPPGAFSILSPTGTVATDQPTIRWEAAFDADAYRLAITKDADCQIEVANYDALTATSQTLETPLPNGDYYSCVTANDLAGNTTAASNNGLAFSINVVVPPGPFSILTPVGTSDVATPEVSWTASANATSYTVTIAGDNLCATSVRTFSGIPSTELAVLVTPGLADGFYYSCVTAHDLNGSVVAADNNGLDFLVDAVDDIPPGPFNIAGPSGVVEDDFPTVTWTSSADAVSYNLIIASDPACASPVQTVNGLTGLSYTVVESLADAEYFTCLTSYDDAGNNTVAANNGLPFIVDAVADPVASYHLAFVTSGYLQLTSSDSYPPAPGGFNSLDAADYNCTVYALNAGLIPNWDGVSLVYQAIMSDEFINASDRLSIEGPIRNMIGEEVAANAFDFWDGIISAPIAYTEYGSSIPSSSTTVWTGTSYDGWSTGSTCESWDTASRGSLATVGDAYSTDQNFLEYDQTGCLSQSARVYCISPPLAE